MRLRNFLLPLVVLFVQLSFGQDLNFINYNTHNGLPSSEVHDVYQDKKGYMWFATDRGLSRYNGETFKTYGLEEGLPGIVVLDFFVQNDGSIWCNTLNNKMFKFIPESEQVKTYPFNNIVQRIGRNREVIDFREFEDRSVKIRFNNSLEYLELRENGEITRLPDFRVIHSDSGVSEHLSDMTISVNIEAKGLENFCYTTSKEKHSSKDVVLSEFSVGRDSIFDFLGYASDKFQVIIANRTVTFYEQEQLIRTIRLKSHALRLGVAGQLFWAAASDGAYFFDEKYELKFKLLDNYAVTSVLVDHEGSYWVTTRSGVFYSPNEGVNHFSVGKNSSLDNLSEYGQGLMLNFQNGDTYELRGDKRILMNRSPRKITGKFECNSTGAFFYRNNSNELPQLERLTSPKETLQSVAYFRNLSDDPKQGLIIVGSSSIFILKNKGWHIISNVSTDVMTDASWLDDHRMWVGQRNGLFICDTVAKKMIPHEKLELSVWITEIDRIQKNRYILGTKENGVFLLNGESDFTKIDESDGLLSNSISEVYVQNESNYWVCSNAGLNRIRKVGGKYFIDSFTTEDGLANNDVTDVVVKNDTVWVGTKSGLDYFPVSLMSKERPKTKVFIELLETYVNDVSMEDLLHLSYNQNKIDFVFKAISFRYKDRLKFRYKMRGLETEWNYSNDRQVSYKSLPPGEYELIIQAGVDDYWYKKEIRKKIYIAQPFYATWYFISGIIALSLLLIYLFFRFRILSYNRYIIKEILLNVQRRMRPKDNSFIVRTDRADVKVDSNNVLYAKAQGNYVELFTEEKKFVIRLKVSEFVHLVPDPNEYLQINRSTVIRKDKVTKKSKKEIVINGTELKIGSTYKDVYDQLYL